MIKIFRKIRQNLLSEGKTGKYLKYAIGEIVLVVIGILIAIGINSKYNASKNETKIEAILTQVQQDLVTDIIDAKRIRNIFIENDSIFGLIMNDSITLELFKKNPFRLNTADWVSFSTHKGGYNQIMNNLENLPEKYKPILPHFNYMYVELQNDIDDHNQSIKKSSDIIFQESLKNNPKEADYIFGRDKDEAREVYFKDPFLRNKSILFMTGLSAISRTASNFRIESIVLYKKIDSLLGKIPGSYSEHLTIMPNLENTNSFVGAYTGSSEVFGDTISIIIDNNQFVLKSQNWDDEKLYWHDGNHYVIKDKNSTIKLYKNKKDQHVLKIYNARINATFIKTKED